MENWKAVVGYEGCYEISKLGNVRSCDRQVRVRGGYRACRGQDIKPKLDKGGYLVVGLSKERKCKYFTIHSLVAAAFIGTRPDGFDCCHVNGLSDDNRKDNLCYKTRLENIRDKHTHGTMARGDGINTSKLNESQVVRIRELRSTGRTLDSLALEFKVSSPAISKICFGEHWAHAAGPITARKQRRRTYENQIGNGA